MTKVMNFAATRPELFLGIIITIAVIAFIAFGNLSADAKPVI